MTFPEYNADSEKYLKSKGWVSEWPKVPDLKSVSPHRENSNPDGIVMGSNTVPSVLVLTNKITREYKNVSFVTSKHVVIFDIDGTLADCSHRLHHIKNGSKRWDLFFAECDKDQPIADVITMLQLMWELGFVICLMSGRSSTVRNPTQTWLVNHQIPYHYLYMRGEKDHRPDDITKKELLQQFKYEYAEERGSLPQIFAVFDDRDRVVNMWRANGIRAYQVAKGDF